MSWNGIVVHEVERLRGLTPRTSNDLFVDLFAQGRQVRVFYDDFRMVRRKAQ